MALESGVTYIEDLVATNPVGATDNVDEGDDHIRNIKIAVQSSFPSLGSAAVTKTAAEINDLAQSTSGTLTSPVINTGVSGTAIDTTTLTDSATLVPSSSVVTDKTANLNTKVVEIGTWDMDATTLKTVAHGLTYTKIRNISVLIRNDTDSTYFDFPTANSSGVGIEGVSVSSTNITLQRGISGTFDSATFDTMGGDGNRGWVTIKYTD